MSTFTLTIHSSEIGEYEFPKSVSPKTKKSIVDYVKKNYNQDQNLVLYIAPDVVEIFDQTPKFVFEKRVEDLMEEGAYLLPVLYSVDKKGKEREWRTWVIDDTVHKSYGEVDGTKTPSTRVYKGVNIGRSNETSAHEQAKREAERDWVKQLDKGYLPKPGKGDDMAKRIIEAKKRQGGVNANISSLIRGTPARANDHDKTNETNESNTKREKKSATPKENVVDDGTVDGYEYDILPMHCQVWSTEPKVLKYFDFDHGVYIQPKLDGIRCLVRFIPDKGVVLLTRKGKQFVWLKHLREEVKIFLKGHEDVMLDCEVYADVIHGKFSNDKKKTYSYTPGDPELLFEQRFDVISGAVRPVRKEPHPLEEQLSLYVFDIADPTGKMDQDQRFEVVKMLFARKGIVKQCPHIKRVETKVIEYMEEVEDYHDEMAEKGYEGVVVRSRELCYESGKHSLRMRKHKMFEDKEFVIVDIACDEGVEREHFKWVCEILVTKEDGTTELKTFNVKPRGTREQKQYWYDNSDEFIGKLLTVAYQKKTKEGDQDDNIIPRFPIGKAIRDYE